MARQIVARHQKDMYFPARLVDAAANEVQFLDEDEARVVVGDDSQAAIRPMISEGSFVEVWLDGRTVNTDWYKARVLSVDEKELTAEVVFFKEGGRRLGERAIKLDDYKLRLLLDTDRVFKQNHQVAIHCSQLAEVVGDTGGRTYYYGVVKSRTRGKPTCLVQLDCKPHGDYLVISFDQLCLRREVDVRFDAEVVSRSEYMTKYQMTFDDQSKIHDAVCA